MKKIIGTVLSLLMLVSQLSMGAIAETCTDHAHEHLDLTSTTTSVAAPVDGSIMVAGQSEAVTQGMALTPAQLVALMQVQAGAQHLQLDAQGAAVGGHLELCASALAGLLAGLVVPQGVTVLANTGTLSQALYIDGLASIQGTLLFGSAANSLNVAELIVGPQGTINNSLAQAGSSLSILSLGSITNQGLISSLGDLNIVAGQVLVNSGTLQSLAGSVNIAGFGSNFLVQNTNGNILAPLGSINVASQLAGANLAVFNGMFQAQNVSFQIAESLSGAAGQEQAVTAALEATSGIKPVLSFLGGSIEADAISFLNAGGQVSVAAERLEGPVSIIAGTAFAGASESDVTISSLELTGDPIFWSGGNLDLGGLFLSPSFTLNTAGGDFVALARGNILASGALPGSLIDAALSDGSGGQVHLAAGVDFEIHDLASAQGCLSCSGLYSVTGISDSGGSINMAEVSARTNGGLITVEAHAGNTSDGSMGIGNLDASGAGGTGGSLATGLPVAGTNGGNAGNVFITADGDVQTGHLRAFGGGGGGGAVKDPVYGGLPVPGLYAPPGNGGNGGIVRLTASNGSVLIDGDINTSGGGGGYNLGYFEDAAGDGGNAGDIFITAAGTFIANGPLIAVGAGNGESFAGGGGGTGYNSVNGYGGGGVWSGGRGTSKTAGGDGGGIFGDGAGADGTTFGSPFVVFGNSGTFYGPGVTNGFARQAYSAVGDVGDIVVSAQSIDVTDTVGSFYTADLYNNPADPYGYNSPYNSSSYSNASILGRNFVVLGSHGILNTNVIGDIYAMATFASPQSIELTDNWYHNNFFFPVGGLAILSGGSITYSGGPGGNYAVVNGNQKYWEGNAGPIHLAAGVDYTVIGAGVRVCDACYSTPLQRMTTFTIDAPSATGGDLILPFKLTSNSTLVSLTAYAGSSADGDIDIGDVTMQGLGGILTNIGFRLANLSMAASGSISAGNLTIAGGLTSLDSGVNQFTLGSLNTYFYYQFGFFGPPQLISAGTTQFLSNGQPLDMANVEFVGSPVPGSPIYLSTDSDLSLRITNTASVTFSGITVGRFSSSATKRSLRLVADAPIAMPSWSFLGVNGSLFLHSTQSLNIASITAEGEVIITSGSTGAGGGASTPGTIVLGSVSTSGPIQIISMGDNSLSSGGNVTVSSFLQTTAGSPAATNQPIAVIATGQIQLNTVRTYGGSVFISSGSPQPVAITTGVIQTTNNFAVLAVTGPAILLSESSGASQADPANIVVNDVNFGSGGAPYIRYALDTSALSQTELPSTLNITPTTAINYFPGGYTVVGSQASPADVTVDTGVFGNVLAPVVASSFDGSGTSMYLGDVTMVNSADSFSVVAAGTVVLTESIISPGNTGIISMVAGGDILLASDGIPVSISGGTINFASAGGSLIVGADLSLSALTHLNLMMPVVTDPGLGAFNLTLSVPPAGATIFPAGFDLRGAGGSRGNLTISGDDLVFGGTSSIYAGDLTLLTSVNGGAKSTLSGTVDVTNLTVRGDDALYWLTTRYAQIKVADTVYLLGDTDTTSAWVKLELHHTTLTADRLIASSTLNVPQVASVYLWLIEESQLNVANGITMQVENPTGDQSMVGYIDFEMFNNSHVSTSSFNVRNENGGIGFYLYEGSSITTTTGGLTIQSLNDYIEYENLSRANLTIADGMRVESSSPRLDYFTGWSSTVTVLSGDFEVINNMGLVDFELEAGRIQVLDGNIRITALDEPVNDVGDIIINQSSAIGIPGNSALTASGRIDILAGEDLILGQGFYEMPGSLVLRSGRFAEMLVGDPPLAVLAAGTVQKNGGVTLLAGQSITVDDGVDITAIGGTTPGLAGNIMLVAGTTIDIQGVDRLVAWGGDILMLAVQQLSVDPGTQLTSVAKLSDVSGYVQITHGYWLPYATGGRIILMAGVPAGSLASAPDNNVLTPANSWQLHTDPFPTLSTDTIARAFGTGNTVEVSDFSWVRFFAPGGTGIDIINSSLAARTGGMIYIDPLGGPNPVFIGGASLLAIAVPPFIGPVIPGGSLNPVGGEVPFQLNVTSESSLQARVATDTLPEIQNPPLMNEMKICGAEHVIDPEHQPNQIWLVAGSGCEAFVFSMDDNTAVMASSGTMLAQTGRRQLSMQHGSALFLAGKEPVLVFTRRAKILVPANTTAVVEAKSEGIERIMNYGHPGSVVEISAPDGKRSVSVAPGEETVLADVVDRDEELAAGDGVERLSVSSGQLTAGTRMKKNLFDGLAMAEKIVCYGKCWRTVFNRRLQSARADLKALPPMEKRLEVARVDTTTSPVTSSPPLASRSGRLVLVSHVSPNQDFPYLSKVHTRSAYLVFPSSGQVSLSAPGKVIVSSGNCLVRASRPIEVTVGHCSVLLKPGTVAMFEKEGDRVAVRNLHERHGSSAQVLLNGKSVLSLYAGQELMVISGGVDNASSALLDSFGRRSTRIMPTMDGLYLCLSEVSLTSLLYGHHLLRQMMASNNANDRQLHKSVLKMSACLSLLTNHRGPYRSGLEQ